MVRGAVSMSSNWPLWSTSTGSIIAGFTRPAVTDRRPSARPSTTISTTPWSPRPERNDPSLQDHRGGSLLAALAVANTLNIAADLVAIGSGAKLLHAGPVWVWSLLAGVLLTGLLLSGTFRFIEMVFKVLCLALLSYLVVLFVVHVDWGQVGLHTAVPHLTFSLAYLSLLVAVLGTTISPYLFFWQSGHRVEDMRDEKAGGNQARGLRRRDRFAASWKLGSSRAACPTLSCSPSSPSPPPPPARTAARISAAPLRPPPPSNRSPDPSPRNCSRSGSSAPACSPSPSLPGRPPSACPDYSANGRATPARHARRRCSTRSSWPAPFGGTALTLTHVNPIHLLVLVALINGVAAAPFLILVMLIARRRDLMGKYRNGALATTLGWTTVALVGGAAIALVVTGGSG